MKKELVEVIWNFFEPYREKHEKLLHDPDHVHDIMLAGAKKTRLVGMEYLERARAVVGLDY